MRWKVGAFAIPLLLVGCVESFYPPDPGEAGKKGLTGVDSDQDGVRDDVERAVVDANGDRPELIPPLFHYAALKQTAFQALSDGLPPPDDYLDEFLRLTGCIEKLAPDVAQARMNAMSNQVTNTSERWVAQLRIDKEAASGKMLHFPEPTDAECEGLEIPPLAPGETAEDVLRDLESLR